MPSGRGLRIELLYCKTLLPALEAGLLAACGVFSIQVFGQLQVIQYKAEHSRDGNSVGGVESRVIIKSIRLPAERSLVFPSDLQRHDTPSKIEILGIVGLASGTKECGPDDRLGDDKVVFAGMQSQSLSRCLVAHYG
ncbi:hypothetical protein V497_09024 [Pseudogymnoascus sp. VKM F-4516 (FW-969)]|nr:hypothetical protein V497_09024 [Pseudogymnoascus sp. VKM F-4516 (FW-969)]